MNTVRPFVIKIISNDISHLAGRVAVRNWVDGKVLAVPPKRGPRHYLATERHRHAAFTPNPISARVITIATVYRPRVNYARLDKHLTLIRNNKYKPYAVRVRVKTIVNVKLFANGRRRRRRANGYATPLLRPAHSPLSQAKHTFRNKGKALCLIVYRDS
ncbi:unnamed protein product [Arctia plantaginis]|uniref:Uncharacterized protein n=1 Tax=Arctia plantaginis TaxID=874455 RepID=A0A8S1AJD7_ARCPL|nr:unnamed protein product [Arctia plantaginis]